MPPPYLETISVTHGKIMFVSEPIVFIAGVSTCMVLETCFDFVVDIVKDSVVNAFHQSGDEVNMLSGYTVLKGVSYKSGDNVKALLVDGNDNHDDHDDADEGDDDDD